MDTAKSEFSGGGNARYRANPGTPGTLAPAFGDVSSNRRPSSVNSLEPEWTAAATAVKEQTKGKVRLGAVDATVHQTVSSRYGVS